LKFKFVEIDNCPECLSEKYEEADQELTLYRLSKSSECQNDEFLPYSKLEDKKHFCEKKRNNEIEYCKCFGLSVEIDRDEILRRHKMMPMLGNYIFTMEFDNKKGKLYLTNSSKWPKHASLFLYEDVEICRLFQKTDELGEKNGSN